MSDFIRIGDRVKHLEHGIAGRQWRLHHPVGDTTCEVVLEPTHGLPHHLGMRTPPNKRAELRQQCVVQDQNVECLDYRTDQQDERRRHPGCESPR